MKKFKIALIVLVSLSVAQPVMAHGNMGPPAKAVVQDSDHGLMDWFYSWF